MENEKTINSLIKNHYKTLAEIETIISNYLKNEIKGYETSCDLVDKVKLIWKITIDIFETEISYEEINNPNNKEVMDGDGKILGYKGLKESTEHLIYSKINDLIIK